MSEEEKSSTLLWLSVLSEKRCNESDQLLFPFLFYCTSCILSTSSIFFWWKMKDADVAHTVGDDGTLSRVLTSTLQNSFKYWFHFCLLFFHIQDCRILPPKVNSPWRCALSLLLLFFPFLEDLPWILKAKRTIHRPCEEGRLNLPVVYKRAARQENDRSNNLFVPQHQPWER